MRWLVLRLLQSSFQKPSSEAGSVTTPDSLQASVQAGVKFAVSPGASTELIEAADSTPLVPGAATASEIMNLKSIGYKTVKFFPAEILGGAKAIRALSEPIQDIQFFPTGGIHPKNLQDYLSIDRVTCVGGSWLASGSDVENGRWSEIESRCSALRLMLT